MKRVSHRLWGLAWFAFVLLLLIGGFSLSYFLTGLLYRALNMQPAALMVQVVNSLLGLVFTAVAVGVVTKAAVSRGLTPEMNVFAPILDALEKIAQGDFSIRVSNEFSDNQIVGRLATSVNKMALELDQMESMRQEFVSNVSHEIQSPLTSIRGFAQALQNDELSADERHHYLDIIESESLRLSRLTGGPAQAGGFAVGSTEIRAAALPPRSADPEPHPGRRAAVDRQEYQHGHLP